MKYLSAIVVLLVCLHASAQNVGVGTSTPSAKLDISSTNSGVLIPRLALTATNAASPVTSPVASMLIYNTATAGSGATAVTPGYYYWDGVALAWVRLIDNVASTNNIYNTDGTLTGTRTLTQGANNLTFSNTTAGVAMGTGLTVTGANSLAIGSTNTVSGNQALVSGTNNTASGSSSAVFGSNNTAANLNSFATGDNNSVAGNSSLISGTGNSITGKFSFATGKNNNADGQSSAVFGAGNSASNANSFATGSSNTVSGISSLGSGDGNIVSGNYNIAGGQNNIASGTSSMVSGIANKDNGTDNVIGGTLNYVATGYGHSIAVGNSDTVTASAGAVFGYLNKITSFEAFAQGDRNTASGQASAVYGANNTASGFTSFVTGSNNTGSGTNAFVTGNGNTASGNNSLVTGNGNIAAGSSSMVSGIANKDNGTDNVIGGTLNYVATGYGHSIAVGNSDTVTASAGAVFGYLNKITSFEAFAQGDRNTASGQASAVYGANNTASGFTSFVTGSNNTGSGTNAFVTGNGNTASGNNSLVTGNGNNAAGNYSVVFNNTNSSTSAATTSITGGFQSQAANNLGVAIGWADTASGVVSMAVGRNNNAPSFAEYAGGTFGTNYTPASTGSINATDRLFNIGNGTSAAARADAFTILKNGNVGIGNSSPSFKLDVNGVINAATGFKVAGGTPGTSTYLKGDGTNFVAGSILAADLPSLSGVYVDLVSAQTAAGAKTWTNNAVFNGTVGLGTASPVSQLANTATNILGTDGQGINTYSLTWAQNASGYTGAFYNANTSTVAQGLAVKIAGTASSNRLLDLSTGAASATAGTSVMVVQGNGNVGIGATTTYAPLDVLTSGGKDVLIGGGANTGSEIKLTYPGIAHMSLYNSNGNLTIANTSTLINTNTAGTPLMTVTNGGYVGIGTTSIPKAAIGSAKFAIDGASGSTGGPHVQYTTSADNYPVYQQLNWTHDNIAMSYDAYFDGSWRSATTTGGNFQLYKLGGKLLFNYANINTQATAITWSPALAISSTNGYVGVGTNSPLINMDFSGGASIGTSATSVSQHDVSNRGTKLKVGAYVSGTLSEFNGMSAVVAAGTNGCGNTGDVTFNTWECNTSASREVMRINGTGNVGIETSTPAATLHVNGTTKLGAPGTVIKSMQMGQNTVGPQNQDYAYPLTFPTPFANAPKVIATCQTQTGQTYVDNFSIIVQSVSTSGCTLKIHRTDATTAWGQTLLVNWIAFDN